jgi:hypothetical protein
VSYQLAIVKVFPKSFEPYAFHLASDSLPQVNSLPSPDGRCGMVNGKRIRYSCRIKSEAEAKAAALREQRRREGENSLAPARLDGDTKQALEILKPHGATPLP